MKNYFTLSLVMALLLGGAVGVGARYVVQKGEVPPVTTHSVSSIAPSQGLVPLQGGACGQ